MTQLAIGPVLLKYKVLYKQQKTISMKFNSTEELEIIVPFSWSLNDVEKFLLSKQSWIINTLTKIKTIRNSTIYQMITAGTHILLLGKLVEVKTLINNHPAVVLSGDELIVTGTPMQTANQTKNLIKSWYLNYATDFLTHKTNLWSAIIGLTPNRITIKDQRTRWGSCSNLKNINYNWRIIMAPPEITDYIVVHELCHIAVPNHSNTFWNMVAKYLPQYKHSRQWLNSKGSLLFQVYN